jgi:hypothetical protein
MSWYDWTVRAALAHSNWLLRPALNPWECSVPHTSLAPDELRLLNPPGFGSRALDQGAVARSLEGE